MTPEAYAAALAGAEPVTYHATVTCEAVRSLGLYPCDCGAVKEHAAKRGAAVESAMPTDDRHLDPALLDEWHALHDGRDGDEPAGIGIQARDRKIRSLIEEVRRLRQLVADDLEALKRLRSDAWLVAAAREIERESVSPPRPLGTVLGILREHREQAERQT